MTLGFADNFDVMRTDNAEVVLRLTSSEAHDLFSRLLKSHEEDTEESRAILKALAAALEPSVDRKAA